ncbi:hypothetical protein Pcinc_010692 [Petrolisthes cinctipes]|uniref:Transposase IS30-like HTH domain-containing protein n=1 Tax=Petrolisthes cinctipes TaxID=88211 RepID=A0AAE1KV53_PETCI|nr:hypothetical protein Pcinc_010692 [Petrolisthes cinctipes]
MEARRREARERRIGFRGRIVGMHEAGQSIRAIANDLGISTRTVLRWIRSQPESAKHRGRRAEEKQRRKICSVFLTHHKKIQPLLKLLLLEELNNLNFIVPIAALSLRIPPSKPSC